MKNKKRLVIVTSYRIKTHEDLHNLVNYLILDIDDAFQEIIIVARLKRTVLNNIGRSHYYSFNNKRICIYPLSYYHGANSLFLKIPNIIIDIVKIICTYYNATFLFRGVDVVSVILGAFFILGRKKYGLQVIGDPKSVYISLNSQNKYISKLLSSFFYLCQKILVRNAIYIMYVTRCHLQKIYKPSLKSKVFSCTDLYLPRKFFKNKPRLFYPKDIWTIVFIGSLEQKYKGLHILFYAVSIVLSRGYKVHLKVLGDGKYRNEYLELSRKLRIDNRVEMLGHIKDLNIIIRILDESDLFILPSLTEGLPRALIEAMARALPCIGSDVGGIPELLDPEDIVPANDAVALAEKIICSIEDIGRLNRMSRRNLEKAFEYQYENIREVRREFYRNLKDI